MTWGDRYRALGRNPMVQTALFILGCTLVAITPLVSAIPGPGGVFVFAAGLTLMLRNSRWAKRRYVRFKRWQPRAGEWSDWGLRRESYRRRKALRDEAAAAPQLD